jgi:putative DNA primase/helicase
VYDGGVYKKGRESLIKRDAKIYLNPLFTTHYIREIINWIKYSTFVDRECFNNDSNIINLKNGLLDLRTLELKSHSPGFLSTIRIPVSYDPIADCPRIKKFLTEVLPQEDIPKVLEFTGYLLVPSYHHNKIFLYAGGGRNGKSKLIALQCRLIGADNCSHVSLHDLQSDRFAAASLYGKLLNSHPDISGKKLPNADVLKSLSGEDRIEAQFKFKQRFSFTNHAKLLFSANEVPQINDESDAFYRRWEIVNFPNRFEDAEDSAKGVQKANKKLIDELSTDEELSGFLNLALEGLHRLEKQGYFTNTKTIEGKAHEYRMLSNPVYGFINERCVVTPDGITPKEDLYTAYCEYCRGRKIPPESVKSYVENLQKFVTVAEYRPTVDGERTRAWKGIELKRAQSDRD